MGLDNPGYAQLVTDIVGGEAWLVRELTDCL
jgi:hypothetical protein